MIKPCQKIVSVRKVFNNKTNSLSSGFNKFFRRDKFIYPMTGKGEEIPCDDQPKENFKFQPADTLHLEVIQTKQQISHANYKEDMADLMSNQPFCTAMRLYGPCRIGHHHQKRKKHYFY